MRLPPVSSSKILEALHTFDRRYRNTPQFTGWESYGPQKYAISYEGKLYPPKVIISLATGVPRSDFSGGRESNSYLANLGFKIIRLSDGNEVRMHERGYEWQGKQAEVTFETSVDRKFAETHKNKRRALVLIPCCKSKVAMLSEGWESPLPGLPALREQLIEKVEDTLELAGRDVNLEGVLNCYATITRALDLYCGNFYYAAEEGLREVADGELEDVDVLIVSAIYGLVKLNEGIMKYELQMGDTLHDGTKVYKYWQKQGLGKILFDYVSKHNIGYVWSLLPDSMPSYPYQQTFKEFWRLSRKKGIECYHVKVPGTGTATGYQRARWLNEVIKTDPQMLVDVNSLPDQLENIKGYEFTYNTC